MYYSSLPRRTKPMKRVAMKSSRKAAKERKMQIAVIDIGQGREKCLRNKAGVKEYVSRRTQMVDRQHGLCAICGEWMSVPQFDHAAGRHPSRRDERILKPDGKTWQNAALDSKCNGIKGSRHYEWVEGNTRYIPVERAA